MIVIDTHIWVWWVMGDSRLKQKYRQLIATSAPAQIGVADTSLFEAAMLIHRKRLKVSATAQDWLTNALSDARTRVLPITSQIAATSVGLPPHHKDPVDRLIMATAIAHGATLLTEDRLMKTYANLVNIL